MEWLLDYEVMSHMQLIFSCKHTGLSTRDQQNQCNIRATQDGKVECYIIKFRELATRARLTDSCALIGFPIWAIWRFIIWLAPRAGKMNQIEWCDWLPERARWSRLASSGLPAVSPMKNFPESHIINPLLTKLVRSRWLNIGLVLSCEFMDRFVSVHRHAEKDLANIQPSWPHTL